MKNSQSKATFSAKGTCFSASAEQFSNPLKYLLLRMFKSAKKYIFDNRYTCSHKQLRNSLFFAVTTTTTSTTEGGTASVQRSVSQQETGSVSETGTDILKYEADVVRIIMMIIKLKQTASYCQTDCFRFENQAKDKNEKLLAINALIKPLTLKNIAQPLAFSIYTSLLSDVCTV